MPWISVADAAERLGVNEQRVRALVAQGRLPAQKIADRWVLDSERLMDDRVRRRVGGRPFSVSRALGLLFLASDEDAPWLSQYDKWRMRRYLERLPELLPRLRARASVAFLRAPEAMQRQLEREDGLALSGVSAAAHYGADIIARGVLDAYCSAKDARRLVHRYALREVGEAAANVILRRLPDAFEPYLQRRVMPVVVVAGDLLDSVDSRTRRAGADLLRKHVR